MTAVREWLIRLWGSIRGHRRDGDLEEELQIHLELAAEDERRRSNSPEGAARAVALSTPAAVDTPNVTSMMGVNPNNTSASIVTSLERGP
jgi:hypothetical protein